MLPLVAARRSIVHNFRGTPDEFSAAVLNSGTAVLVDFHAKWCAPCKDFSPTFEAFSTSHPSVKFYSVDIEENETVAAMHDIRCIPTFLGFDRNGKIVGTLEGAHQDKVQDLLVKLSG